ncbi:MAG TPA: NAD-dependent epimerase/dehydratase family protein, partial [Vicinamibacteria bacterium]
RGQRPSPFGSRVKTIAGDRADTALLRGAARAERFDAVVDFLAYRPEQVEAAIEAFGSSVGQYVFISSASVYERPLVHYLVTEETPRANPFWEYARQKIACEERLVAAYRQQGFPLTIVRPSYTYGPTWIPSGFGGQDYTVVDRIRRGLPIVCHGDGTALWTMTASSDFAVGLVGLLGRKDALGESFHITSDEVLTWDGVYRAIGRAAGREPELVHVPSDLIAALYPERGGSLLGDKAWSAVFDNGKIKRFVPEFATRTLFADGMTRSVAWFDADPSRQIVSEKANAMIDRVIAAQRRAFEG